VGDEQDRDAALPIQPPEERGDLDLIAEVEVRRRLVEDEQARLLGEGARDERALTLAAAQMIKREIGQLEDAGGLHRRPRGRVVLPALEVAAGPMRIATHQDELADVEGTLGGRALGHDAHAARQIRAREPADRHTFETDLAGRGLEHARQEPDQRRLARAVRPDHADHLAGGQLQRDLRQRKRPAPGRRRIREADTLELEQPLRRHQRFAR
jgi:hypothetical protein